MNPKLGFQFIYKYDGTSQTAAKLNDIKAQHLVVYNNKIYYYATGDSLKVCDLNGQNQATLKTDVKINDMYAADGKIYFSSVSKNNTGFYVYDTQNGTIKTISDKPANGIGLCDGKIYFICSAVTYVAGQAIQNQSYDGSLYCYDGTSVKKV